MGYHIPSLNLNDFIHGDSEQKNKFVKDLGHAYEEIGFVAISGHGLSTKVVSEMYDHSAKFFSLDNETKLKYESLDGQRGYTPFGKEQAKGNPEKDLKEFWHFGQYLNVEDELNQVYPPNKIVKELIDFNISGKNMFQGLETVANYMLSAIALYLNLDKDYFKDKVNNGNSILRVLHYPPLNGEPKGRVRAGEHGDINLITLLVGASASGLEVKDKKGNWVPITAIDEHLIVNVGDMLERLTNNKLRSTLHRVVNPPKSEWEKPRFSIPFFLHPRPEVELNCLPSCITDENPKQYEDITAMEFLLKRLEEIGLM